MIELAYLAGLIDGEGSVGWYGTKKRFYIEIKMTAENIIDWLIENFGGHKQPRPPAKSHWKMQYRWRVQDGHALELYERVKPYLKLKLVE